MLLLSPTPPPSYIHTLKEFGSSSSSQRVIYLHVPPEPELRKKKNKQVRMQRQQISDFLCIKIKEIYIFPSRGPGLFFRMGWKMANKKEVVFKEGRVRMSTLVHVCCFDELQKRTSHPQPSDTVKLQNGMRLAHYPHHGKERSELV